MRNFKRRGRREIRAVEGSQQVRGATRSGSPKALAVQASRQHFSVAKFMVYFSQAHDRAATPSYDISQLRAAGDDA
jgi:hypothetical protein